MKRRSPLLPEILSYLALYPVIILLLVVSGVSCTLAFNLGRYLAAGSPAPTPPSVRQMVRLPAAASTTAPRSPQKQAAEAGTNLAPSPKAVAQVLPTATAPPPAQPSAVSQNQPATNVNSTAAPQNDAPPAQPELATAAATITPTPFPTLDLAFYEGRPAVTRAPAGRTAKNTATPESLLQEWVSSLMDNVTAADAAPPTEAIKRTKYLPTLTATPSSTPTPTASPTPTPTATPTETPIPSPTATFTAAPPSTNTPPPTETPTATPPPPPTTVPSPTNTPPPTATPLPEYDFMLNEFFNSPTTNSFLVMYVAIVDVNEIPIGGLKVVGTRLDHNLTYESPLSTWHYEGYNAPGDVAKTGNVKFEPPGGIENTSWLIHLADAQGNQLSDKVPFDTNPNDKQWYFVKFRRKH